MSVINYLIKKSMVLDIMKYKESIVLASFILKIANTIDILTSPFTKNQNNYSTLCINAINEANKIKYISLNSKNYVEIFYLEELYKIW